MNATAHVKKMDAERKKSIENIAGKMLLGKDSHVKTMFHIPMETDAKFRIYCAEIVNGIDKKYTQAGFRVHDRRGKRSDGKGPTFFAFMELMAASREDLTDHDREIVAAFEKLLIELMGEYRFNRDFVKA